MNVSRNFAVIDLEDNKELYLLRGGDFDKLRIDSFLEKEPETLIWLNRLNKQDVLWDIGANIGVYSIYASKTIGNKSYAFEPSSNNTLFIQQNINANKLNNLVTLYPIAVGKNHSYDLLDSKDNQYGHTGSEVRSSEYGNNNTKYLKEKYTQGCVVDSIDSLVEKGVPPPTHLKIDVDGLEPDIIKGAIKTLPKVKSILVEVVTKTHRKEMPEARYATPEVVEAHKNLLKYLKDIGFEEDQTLTSYSKLRCYKSGFEGLFNFICYNKNVE